VSDERQHPDREHVLERQGDDYFHSRLQTLLTALLGSRERERRFRTFIAATVQAGAGPSYRVPDLCVKAMPHRATPILIQPDLAIEVVSPDDEVPEMLTKIGDYLAAGLVGEIDFGPLFRQLDEPAE
jgi:Uma2 family endonuclease